MRPVAVFWLCLTSAAIAFLIGVILTAHATTHRIAQADDQHPPPPAGDQFDEGPVLVRLPSASASTIRFIF